MKYRTLGKTGFQISEIGFGAWAIGGGMWGPSDDAVSLAALRRALDLGVNFIDTAAVYGSGLSEQLVGKVYRERKGKVTVATKIPPKNFRWPPPPDTPIKEAFPASWIIAQTENSLRNLNVDCVDVQQLHVWSSNWIKQSDWYETMVKLREQGKLRHIGVSINDHRPDEAVELARSDMADTIQVIYNIFDQSPEDALFPACREKKVGIIARVPFDEGSLTGKLTRDSKFPEGDFRQHYFKGKRLIETLDRVEKLKKVVAGKQDKLSAVALKFCLAHPAVSTVIPGIRNPEQAEMNTATSDRNPLDPALLAELRKHRWDQA